MKRACDSSDSSALVPAKKPNDGAGGDANGGALVAAGGGAGGGALVAAGPARTSELLAPIMLLTGHAAAVNSVKFSPDGQHVLSGSHDKMLLLWNTFGECENTLNFKGHSNAVLEVQWAADGEYAFSSSADKTAALWDAKTGARVRQFKGHADVVSSICPSRESTSCATGSDDRSARLWDSRVRVCQRTVSHPWQVTAVSMGHDGKRLFTGSLDGIVRSYDLRRCGHGSLARDTPSHSAAAAAGCSLLAHFSAQSHTLPRRVSSHARACALTAVSILVLTPTRPSRSSRFSRADLKRPSSSSP